MQKKDTKPIEEIEVKDEQIITPKKVSRFKGIINDIATILLIGWEIFKTFKRK